MLAPFFAAVANVVESLFSFFGVPAITFAAVPTKSFAHAPI